MDLMGVDGLFSDVIKVESAGYGPVGKQAFDGDGTLEGGDCLAGFLSFSAES